MLFEYGKRLDQFDYEILGVEEWWSIIKAAQMFTSFEMENKGYFGREDFEDVFKKLFEKYERYITNILEVCSFEINTPPNAVHESYYPKDTILINPLTTTFPQKEFLEVIEMENKLKIDTKKLRRLLSGDEAPNIMNHFCQTPVQSYSNAITDNTNNQLVNNCNIVNKVRIAHHVSYRFRCANNDQVAKESLVVSNTDTSDSATDIPQSAKVINASVQQYRFEKVGQSWNIQFGDIELNGVKHSVGMDYIRTLLQKPHYEIGVFDLQSMINPDNIRSHREQKNTEAMLGSKDEIENNNSEAPGSTDYEKALHKLSAEDREKISMLKQQIEQHEDELKDAIFNQSMDAGRLTALISILKEDMYDTLYARVDDPELDKNRKKIYKNIEDARKNIKAVEIENGYMDTPTYNYLKKYIETGYTCEYNPLVDDAIVWML